MDCSFRQELALDKIKNELSIVYLVNYKHQDDIPETQETIDAEILSETSSNGRTQQVNQHMWRELIDDVSDWDLSLDGSK